jgi:hypothetical protein
MDIGRPAGRALETFRMIPDRLWTHPDIKDFDVRLWCALAFFAMGQDRCGVTDAALAGRLRVSDRTIRRGLRNLERSQFIRCEMSGRERTVHLAPTGDGRPVEQFKLRVMVG